MIVLGLVMISCLFVGVVVLFWTILMVKVFPKVSVEN